MVPAGNGLHEMVFQRPPGAAVRKECGVEAPAP
jgi:hypothetical protein